MSGNKDRDDGPQIEYDRRVKYYIPPFKDVIYRCDGPSIDHNDNPKWAKTKSARK